METEQHMASLEAAVAQLQEEKAHLQSHAHQLQAQLQAGQQPGHPQHSSAQPASMPPTQMVPGGMVSLYRVLRSLCQITLEHEQDTSTDLGWEASCLAHYQNLSTGSTLVALRAP